jgi:DNA adenine methylase
MTPERPVLRYFGGKWRLAPWIISKMPPHERYIEPFGGGASVLLRKPRSRVEVYNDIDSEVVNVFRCFRDPAKSERLIELLRLTPFAREELEMASERTDQEEIERARRTIVRAFQGFASQPGKARPGFRCATAVQNTTAATDWANYLQAVPVFRTRLEGVTVENVDAFELLGRYDSEQTLYYVDPPYLPETRRSSGDYAYELTLEQHKKLCEVLTDLQGMVILSGYTNPIYDSLGWAREEIKHYAQGNNAEMRERTEVLWLNPAAVKASSQMNLFEVKA